MTSPTDPKTLLGRRSEVELARAVLTEAKGGQGRLIVVLGEAGIGKTALLRAVERDAEHFGFACLSSRAVASGGSLRPVSEALVSAIRDAAITGHAALQPYRFALARLLPGWHQDAPPAVMDPTVLLGEAVLQLMAVLHGEQPVMVTVDDVHWADPETLALLEYLAGAVRALPFVLAVGVRSSEQGADEMLRLTRHADGIVLELGALQDQDLQAVAQQRAGSHELPDEVKRFVAAQAEGLPLLAEELVDGLVRSGVLVPVANRWRITGVLTTQVPHTLAELARSRLADLDVPHARDVLIAAAVIGRTIDWGMLAAVLDIDEFQIGEGLDAAAALQFLERANDRDMAFRWRHGLLRDAVLEQAPPAEVRRMSLRAANALASVTAPLGLSAETDLLVVELLLRAGEPDAAAMRLVSLATVSIQRGAMRTAEHALERALYYSSDPEMRNAANVQRVRLLTLTGRATEAVRSSDALLLGVEDEARHRLLIALARAAIATGHWAAALAFLDRDDAGAGSSQVAAVRADAHYGAGRLGQASELAQWAVDDPELAATPDLLSGAYEVLARCVRMEDPGESAKLFRRAADVAESAGLAPARVRALFGLGSARLLAGDDVAFFLEVRELALDAGLLAEAAGADLMIGEDQWLSHGPARALPTVESAAELAEIAGLDELRAICLLMVATCHVSRGDQPAAQAAIDEIAEGIRNPDAYALRHVVRAIDLFLARDLQGARDELDASIALVRDHESSGPLPHWGLWALVSTSLGDGGAAREEVRGSVFVTREVNRGGLQYADAIDAGRAGRGQEAAKLMSDGDESLRRHHWWRRTLRLLVHQAAVIDGWGDPVSGLRADLAGFEADGASRQATIARDLLRAAGASVPRRGRGDSAIPPRLRALGITSREGDVLKLVATGLTNADIADRLFLSVRTVETHVANLLAKTGAADRGELAPYAAQLSP